MGKGHIAMGRRGTTFPTNRFAALAALLGLLAGGCVERRVLIRTNPPGALVYVDDHEVPGLTPVAISPIYYGQRKIRLVKDGYETKTVIQSMPPPWYEVPPLDFFSENVLPGTLHDARTLDFQLQPQCVVPKEDLLARAETLRRGTQSVNGVATPGFRVNPSQRAPLYVPPSGGPGNEPIGEQPSYQLPPGATMPAPSAEPITAPPPGAGPAGTFPGPSYQPPSLPPGGPAAPSGAGSQPIYPLPGS